MGRHWDITLKRRWALQAGNMTVWQSCFLGWAGPGQAWSWLTSGAGLCCHQTSGSLQGPWCRRANRLCLPHLGHLAASYGKSGCGLSPGLDTILSILNPAVPLVITSQWRSYVLFKNEKNFPFFSFPLCRLCQNYVSHPGSNPSLVLDQLTFTSGSGTMAHILWRTAHL